MRRWIRIIFISLLLAGGAVLCIVRWQAWFGMPAEPQWTGDTLRYVFPTPLAYSQQWSEQEDYTILVLGDIHNRLTRADYDTLAARVPQADALAQAGDWMDRGQEYYYQLLLREWTNSALYGMPVIACPGNHEYSKGLKKELSPVWSKAFVVLYNGPADVPGATYYEDLPGMRFIVIDTNPLDRLAYLTRTLTWLRKIINGADNRYIIVMMHHPVLSAGRGRFNVLIYAAFRHVLKDADLVIAGHDHSYMRSKNFVVLNAAGIPKKQHSCPYADVTDSVPTYGVLTIQEAMADIPQAMDFKVHRFCDGAIIDSLHVQHD